LKHDAGYLYSITEKSPPARGRGLKQGGGGWLGSITAVAPRAGAWIETH